jgi:hypothetical protein
MAAYQLFGFSDSEQLQSFVRRIDHCFLEDANQLLYRLVFQGFQHPIPMLLPEIFKQ